MRDLVAEITGWLRSGRRVAAATVVEVEGSAPRPLGTMMAVSDDGRIAGNVSAGCVDAAVVEAASDVLRGRPCGVVRFGISDAQALSVGLTCGGRIAVVVSALEPSDAAALVAVHNARNANEPVVLAVATAGPVRTGALLTTADGAVAGDLGDAEGTSKVVSAAREMLGAGSREPRRLTSTLEHDEMTTLLVPLASSPRMLIFGATDYAAALAQVGSFLGYRVTVCDARRDFAAADRFPAAEEVVAQWPHRFLAETFVDAGTVICVLTHDPKFDAPVLAEALRTPAGYIGMIGSRRTAAHRLDELRTQGVVEAELGRIRTPVGLDLGGRTPEETAIAIAAEIIALQHGGSGAPLRDLAGAIHRPVPS